MTWRALAQGWRQTRMAPAERRQHMRVLREVTSGLRAPSHLEQVHATVRSSIRLHTRVHWADLRTRSRTQGVRELLRGLPPLLLAPVSSLGRRLGGVPNEAAQDPSLKATWQRVMELAGVAQDGSSEPGGASRGRS